jgi:rhomboid protease GluP
MKNIRPIMCPNCRALLDSKLSVCEYCHTELGASSHREPAFLSKFVPQENFTTMVILLVNFGMFAATLLLTMKNSEGAGFLMQVDGRILRLFGAKDAFFIAHGEWWRLITAGFLHAGVFHILMNSWVLLDLGRHSEEVFGTSRFLVIYFVSNILGFIASLFWSPHAISVGASAAVCGLIGAMIAHGYRTGSSYRSFYMRWAAIIILIGLMPGFHIDNAAHLGGMAAGFVIAYFAGVPHHSSSVEFVWKISAVAVLLVVVYSFYQVYESMTAVPLV